MCLREQHILNSPEIHIVCNGILDTLCVVARDMIVRYPMLAEQLTLTVEKVDD